MDTRITRIWMNNSNNFVISSCPEKHAAAVAEMVSKGGVKLEDKFAAHVLGEVLIINDAKNSALFPNIHNQTTLRMARENRRLSLEEVSEKTGISVARLKKIESDSSKTIYSDFFTLLHLYDIGVSHIYCGKDLSVSFKTHAHKEKSPTSAKTR